MEEFKAGKKISLANGGDITVIAKLGEGGQGTVYKVSYNGKEYALKWYFPKAMKQPDRFYKNLENNVTKGSPDKAFLWPQAVTQKQDGSFGYIMDLRPTNYVDFAKVLNASVHFNSTSAVINALLNMVLAFQALHRKGYSYQDINDGNFFVDPSNGDVLICDNDNVAPHGESLGVGGKSRYMAPEVVLGNSRPNYNTDLYSLSVILFMILFVSHPLEGAQVAKCPCLTETHERKFYAEEPMFIFNPDNSDNRPVRGIHNNAITLWPLFPQYLRDMFIRAFKEGLNENSRITEQEWKKVLLRLRDDVYRCPKCREENFASAAQGGTAPCIGCKASISAPLILQGKDFAIALLPQKAITAWHTEQGDFNEQMGVVVQNKNNPNLWGLRNLSDRMWQVSFPNGQNKAVQKGEVFPAVKGVEIDFGGGKAVIQ